MLAKIAFVLASITVTAAVAEVAVRVIAMRKPIYNVEMMKYAKALQVPDPRGEASHVHRTNASAELMRVRTLTARYAPFIGWTHAPYDGETIHIDGDGNRFHSATTNDPIGVVRFLGDSVLWGTGVDDESTMPAQFNRLFPDRRRSGAGLSSARPAHPPANPPGTTGDRKRRRVTRRPRS